MSPKVSMKQDTGSQPGGERKRRSTQEIRALIVSAARQEFAAHGFDGATTKAIAKRAGVLESLLFSNFGNKTAIFEKAILEPITGAFEEGVLASDHYPLDGSELRLQQFISASYAVYKANADLLQALVKSSGEHSADLGVKLQAYFTTSEHRQRVAFANGDAAFDVDPQISTRLLFGMMISTIVLRVWMFPNNAPDDQQMVSALTRLIHKAARQTPTDAAAEEHVPSPSAM